MGKYKGEEKKKKRESLVQLQNCGFNTPAAVLTSTSHIIIVAVVEMKK